MAEFAIQWRNLSYKVPKKVSGRLPEGLELIKDGRQQNDGHILTRLTGGIKSGQLTALLGSSGSGKTTLLESILKYRKSNSDSLPAGLSGSIQLAGHLPEAGLQICSVPQRDAFYERFTVMETLRYASRLKNPTFKSRQDDVIVDEILTQLDLQDCSAVPVIKCSGGELKRLSIGCELVSRPDVLLLDEPTSGLDSCTSLTIIRLLKTLVSYPNNPKRLAILAAIHQPSREALQLFDHVILLAKGFQCPFDGRPDEVIDRLGQVGVELKAESDLNAAELLIECATGRRGSATLHQLISLQQGLHGHDPNRNYTENGKRPSLIPAVDRLDPALHIPLTAIDVSDAVDLREIRKQSNNFSFRIFLIHTWIIFTRSLISLSRDPLTLFIRLFAHIIVPVIGCLVFGFTIGSVPGCPQPNPLSLDLPALLDLAEQRDAIRQDYIRLYLNLAAVFLSLMCMMILSLGLTILTIPLEAAVLRRESSRNSWYSLAAYYFGRTAADIPLQVVFMTIYVIITWLATDQPAEWFRFAGFLVVMQLVGLISQSIGHIVGILCADNITAAMSAGIFSVTPFLLFNNFLNNDQVIIWWLRPALYGSHMYHAYNAVVAILYAFGRCSCAGSELLDQEEGAAEAPYWVRLVGRLTDTAIGYSIQATDQFDYDEEDGSSTAKERLTRILSQAGLPDHQDGGGNSSGLFLNFLINSLACQQNVWKPLNATRHVTCDPAEVQSVAATQYGLSDESFATSLTWLVGLLLTYRLAFYCVLRLKI